MDATVSKPPLSRPRLAAIVVSGVAIGAIAALYGLYLNRNAGKIVEAKILLGWLIAVAGLAVVVAAQMAAPVRQRPHANLAEGPPHPDAPGWQSQLPAGVAWERVEVPHLEVSSTDLRARVVDGRPLDYLLPPAVINEIRQRRLYGVPV